MITLALTHYNRFDMLLEAVEDVIDDSRITEVIISDDASTDGSWERLNEHFDWNPKVVLSQNLSNIDCYANKRRAVKMSTNEWVILFDSDNILDKVYIDTICTLRPWDSGVVYCPEFAYPHFDYREFSGCLIDKQNVRRMMQRSRKTFACLLNTANYFVNRDAYLEVWDGSVDPHTADSIYQAYNLMKSGRRRFFVVPGLRYIHRVHDGSHYKRNVHKTCGFDKKVENLIMKLR